MIEWKASPRKKSCPKEQPTHSSWNAKFLEGHITSVKENTCLKRIWPTKGRASTKETFWDHYSQRNAALCDSAQPFFR
jgi:hypothetical protein